jgi:YHS domain-containing protein
LAKLLKGERFPFSSPGVKATRFRVPAANPAFRRTRETTPLETFVSVLDQLRDVWRPRLEALSKQFGERVKVTPYLEPSRREATFEFQSTLACIRLRFTAKTERNVTRVILGSDLEIVPVLTRFEPHAELEIPLDKVDGQTVGNWIDDRIVAFVRTYLSLHENDLYLKDDMVEDPIAHVRFPRFAAGATLEHNGQTYYFIGEDTRREFAKQQKIGSK